METTLLTQHFFRMFSLYLHTLDRTIQFHNQNVPFRNLKNLICLHSKVLNISYHFCFVFPDAEYLLKNENVYYD